MARASFPRESPFAGLGAASDYHITTLSNPVGPSASLRIGRHRTG